MALQYDLNIVMKWAHNPHSSTQLSMSNMHAQTKNGALAGC